jgi:peptidoglycan/xylan/chitin deacetylase (PgdA/CDA1 family)
VIGALLAATTLLLYGSYRYAWWRPTVDYRRPRILMYHMISEHRRGARFNKLRLPPRQFERQLQWLTAHGWSFASMAELQAPASLPPKTVILTFDDGYADNLLNADPLLARYGARATLYLVERRENNDWSTRKKAHHDSGELQREAKLTDAQVTTLLRSGRWELGGHTRSHANLAQLDEVQRREEIATARDALRRRFAVPLHSFAYPFGIYTPRDVEVVREAGYRTAVTTVEGIPADPLRQALELPRIKISGREGLYAFRLRLRCGRRGW